MKIRGSYILATVAWAHFFGLSWGFFLGKVPHVGVGVLLLVLFFLIGVAAPFYGFAGTPPEPPDKKSGTNRVLDLRNDQK